LRVVFHLPLRQTEGFLGSLLQVMGLDCGATKSYSIAR
jgi:hypothetical protein